MCAIRAVVLLMLAALPLAAQTGPETVPETAPTPATVEEALHQMADVAGVIFSGEVVSIRQVAGEGGASGVVEVAFRVEEAVRGCAGGQVYTLREWAGLWTGEPRYRVGQRLLMLLHAPGASGISSPVGGMDGAIPLRATTPAVGQGSGAAMARTATAGSAAASSLAANTEVEATPVVADLRWVGTRLARAPQTSAGVVTGSAASSAGSSAASSSTATSSAADSSTAMQQAAVETVLGMLRSWPQPQR